VNFTVSDEIDFKIPGELNYRLSIGGFLNNKKVGARLPALQWQPGLFATPYLNSFQLASYYRTQRLNPSIQLSTSSTILMDLTNKILCRFKSRLVVGTIVLGQRQS
jgi:hypothetical protein